MTKILQVKQALEDFFVWKYLDSSTLLQKDKKDYFVYEKIDSEKAKITKKLSFIFYYITISIIHNLNKLRINRHRFL